jgi:hypothetical protein
MAILEWHITRADHDAIMLIVERFERLIDESGGGQRLTTRRELVMDLTACHVNGCALDLAGLYAAPQMDFAHDVLGIWRHLDRSTGKLGDCFVPRYAAANGVTHGG